MRSRIATVVLLLGLAACGDDDGAPVDVDASPGADGATPDGPTADAADVSVPLSWTFELEARANFAVNRGGAFNMPPDHFMSGSPSIQVNDAGQVAFPVPVSGSGERTVWWGQGGTGSLGYTAPTDAFMGDVTLNASGRVVFDLSDVAPEGIHYYDPSARPTSALVTGEPLGASRGGPMINDRGDIGFRATVGLGHAHYVYPADGPAPVQLAAETALDPRSPYSFLFSPAFNARSEIAGAARRGPGTDDSQPDEIVIWSGDEARVVARDIDADEASPYDGFDASRVGLNDRGQVAFIADLVAGGRGVFLTDGRSTITIATEGQGEVGDIEFFPPDVNDSGMVVFRAFDADGLRAIWVGDGVDLRRVVSEHQTVPTDLGDGAIDQNDPSFPVFAGSPAINQRGDVAFAAGLAPVDDDQVEWGTAVYLAIADR